MTYSIRELSELAGVSARTLRYYDEIKLLKPLYTDEKGQRYYGEKEVNLLQQILFYRERGLELKEIHEIIYRNDFDIVSALEEHLLELEEKKRHVDALICSVKQTILSMKGDYRMKDSEKFEAFKAQVIENNEKKYGREMRRQYGDDAVENSNKKIKDMSERDWEEFKNLERSIRKDLEACVSAGESPEGERASMIVKSHRKWLMMTWKSCTAQAHKGVAQMYAADERFKNYYDKNVEGCGAFLNRSIEHWAGRI